MYPLKEIATEKYTVFTLWSSFRLDLLCPNLDPYLVGRGRLGGRAPVGGTGPSPDVSLGCPSCVHTTTRGPVYPRPHPSPSRSRSDPSGH